MDVFFKRSVTSILLILVFSVCGVQAGINDVPFWLRNTQWEGHFVGCDICQDRYLEVHIYDDARYILRFDATEGLRESGGFYVGHINYDPLRETLQFNPETDITWIRKPYRVWGWQPVQLKASSNWGFSLSRGSIYGEAIGCGSFQLNRKYK